MVITEYQIECTRNKFEIAGAKVITVRKAYPMTQHISLSCAAVEEYQRLDNSQTIERYFDVSVNCKVWEQEANRSLLELRS